MEVQIKSEDIQAVISSNKDMALQVQIQALIRCVGELEEENKRLTSELANRTNGKKEK